MIDPLPRHSAQLASHSLHVPRSRPHLAEPNLVDADSDHEEPLAQPEHDPDEDDAVEWFLENNPHAATATGPIRPPSPERFESPERGHARLEAVLADSRYHIALADPKKIVDRPVAVFEHSPRKMAAAARLLPHVRFLQPPERDEDGTVVRTEGGMVVRAAAQSPEEGADSPETDRQMVVREEKDTGALRLENSPTKVWA